MEALYIHTDEKAFSIVMIGATKGSDGKWRPHPYSVAIRDGQIETASIPVPESVGDRSLLRPSIVPYWGISATTSPLSPLLGSAPIWLSSSPWLEYADGVLIDIRTGDVREFKSHRRFGVRHSALGMALDGRTLIAITHKDEGRNLVLLLIDTIADTTQAIALESPAFQLPRNVSGEADASAVTPAWILRHFDVVVSDGRPLQLYHRPARNAVASPAFVASEDGMTLALSCVGEALAPLIISELRNHWSAVLDDEPFHRPNNMIVHRPCVEFSDRAHGLGTRTWFGHVGYAEIALTMSGNTNLSLTLMGHAGEANGKPLSPAHDALARATFDALRSYLNERLQSAEWQAHLLRN
jgi:hypothetical protein